MNSFRSLEPVQSPTKRIVSLRKIAATLSGVESVALLVDQAQTPFSLCPKTKVTKAEALVTFGVDGGT
jgi:hypothetical protein